jgi:hypothetical protein
VASEWPVCRIGDMASPQRMGAALTYARRYALFTLVGIAGEDDLDAPDLGQAEPEPGSLPEPTGRSEPRGDVATGHANGSRGRKHPATPKQLLEPRASAVLREQLLIELAAILTADEAAVWAQRKLPAKNTLTPDDADIIEQTFRAKLDSLDGMGTDEVASSADGDGQRDGLNAQSKPNGPELDTGLPPDTIMISEAPKLVPKEEDQNARLIMKPVRKRDKAHRDFVCSQPCLICGRRPSDAHHIRFGQPRALGSKVSDEFTVPLCRVHHAICIAAAMKRRGGRPPKSSRWRLLKSSGARRGIKGGDGICGAYFRLSFSRTERHLKQRRFVYARPDQLAVLAVRRAALSSWPRL